MSAPPPLPPPSSEGVHPHGASPGGMPPKKGLSGCAIAAIILGAVAAIGVVVIAILAAIAIPQYQDYLIRTRVNAVVLAAYDLQSAVDEHRLEYDACPDPDAFAAMAAEPVETGTGDSALSGRWEWREPDADGQCGFAVVFAKPGHPIDGKHMEFRQDGTGDWGCDGGTLPAAYRGPGCRAAPPARID